MPRTREGVRARGGEGREGASVGPGRGRGGETISFAPLKGFYRGRFLLVSHGRPVSRGPRSDGADAAAAAGREGGGAGGRKERAEDATPRALP